MGTTEATDNGEKFTFFYGGVFSQWHKCSFDIGRTYNCAEQYMMFQKAMTFRDHGTADKIMSATHPRDQKRLGRMVANYDDTIWNAIVREIVYEGNKAKFTQNQGLLEQLFATDGTTLVEASPSDRKWGIGLYAHDQRALSRSTWRGTNWLGEVLTKLRDDLIQERDKNATFI